MMELFNLMDKAAAAASRLVGQVSLPVVRDLVTVQSSASAVSAHLERAAALVSAVALDRPGARRISRQVGLVMLAAADMQKHGQALVREAGALMAGSGNKLVRALGKVVNLRAVQSLGGRLLGGRAAVEAAPAAGFLLELSPDDVTLQPFRFALDRAAFDELSRATEFGIASQDRLTRRPAAQAVGKGSDKITLKGAIYLARHGAGHVDRLRELGEALQPLTVTTGYGRNLGRWYLASLQEEQAYLFADGAPRKQTFTLGLTRYGDDYQNL